MSRDSYLTTQDKIQTAIRPSHGAITAVWAAATAASAAAMVAVGTGVVAFGLGLAAVYSGYKTLENAFSKPKKVQLVDSHSTKDDLRELDRELQQAGQQAGQQTKLQAGLANNRDPIPQLTDDIAQNEWRKQIADRAREDAVLHANRGR